MRNPQRWSLLHMKGKQQLTLMTIDLMFLVLTPANTIPSWLFKTEIKIVSFFLPFHSPKKTEQRWKTFGQRMFIWFSCSYYTEEEIKFAFSSAGKEAQNQPISEVWFLPDLVSCTYKLPLANSFIALVGKGLLQEWKSCRDLKHLQWYC